MVNPLEVPPYLLQPLIPSVTAGTVTCAQAFGKYMTIIDDHCLSLPPWSPSIIQESVLTPIAGSEIYVGCSNGELLRYALQPDADPTKVGINVCNIILIHYRATDYPCFIHSAFSLLSVYRLFHSSFSTRACGTTLT